MNQPVMDAIAPRENININNGDDIRSYAFTAWTPLEMLKAVSTIRRYIEPEDLNDTMDRKVEALLEYFMKQH